MEKIVLVIEDTANIDKVLGALKAILLKSKFEKCVIEIRQADPDTWQTTLFFPQNIGETQKPFT